ncbi:isopentenyl-diphosphate delta-isomerase [Ramicandelaber brevisporus]|nr:isopentenyl-diphosphate delta-isomerase [Ramicandelaber brevisporus]
MSTPAAAAADNNAQIFDGHDPEQIRLMQEMCIVIDRDDNQIGVGSKKECHLMSNISATGLLHRAFSVFLFDDQGRLLLQQRASEKITFPDHYTNTCCSHPLNVPDEIETTNSAIGVRRAAQRKLEHELGIPTSQVPLDELVYLTRIHYLAPSDGLWGEHEIDYIFVFQTKTADKNVDLTNLNANEVRDVKYVTQEELKAMFADESVQMTPWFKLICETFLFKWWDNLANIKDFQDHSTIHRLGF